MENKINPVRKEANIGDNKKISQSCSNKGLSNGIKEILDKEVRPLLAMHAGDCEFVGFENGVVKLRLKGACHGCMLSDITLKAGVEQILKTKIPEVKSVEAIES